MRRRWKLEHRDKKGIRERDKAQSFMVTVTLSFQFWVAYLQASFLQEEKEILQLTLGLQLHTTVLNLKWHITEIIIKGVLMWLIVIRWVWLLHSSKINHSLNSDLKHFIFVFCGSVIQTVHRDSLLLSLNIWDPGWEFWKSGADPV